MRRYRLAVLGGTFDHLHVGHHALIATAFRVGREVAIGVTTDRFIAEHPKPDSRRIEPYAVRRATLTRWIRRNFPGRRWRAVPLENPFGRSVDPEVDVLVVSRDTLDGGRAVNRERRRLGRPPVPLVVVPIVLADDLGPVSSRRIRAGEIATDGRRFTPIRVGLQAARPEDREASRRAVLTVFPQARVADLSSTSLASIEASDLILRVARPRAGGWSVTERTPRVRLRARKIPGARPVDLERGLIALIRPREERKLFDTHRSSPT